LYLLVLGVNRYHDKALWRHYAVPDGQALITTLGQTAAPLFRDVVSTTLFDEHATLATLEETFAKLAAQVKTVESVICGRWITIRGPGERARLREVACHSSALSRNCAASLGVNSATPF
jgi:hypothetical protein